MQRKIKMNIFSYYFNAITKNYATFTGRARRKEYFSFLCINLLIIFIFATIDAGNNQNTLVPLWRLITLLPAIGVTIRRMHDVDKSGWFMLIPIYNLILVFTPGTKGSNRFGPDPIKEAERLNS